MVLKMRKHYHQCLICTLLGSYVNHSMLGIEVGDNSEVMCFNSFVDD